MAEKGRAYILRVRKKWRFNGILSGFLLALGCTAVVISLLYRLSSISLFWVLPLFSLIALLILSIERPWNISSQDVSRFLNNRFPALEESSQLFLKPQHTLSLLERIQTARMELIIHELPKIGHRILLLRLIAFVLALFVSLAILVIPLPNGKEAVTGYGRSKSISTKKRTEILPASVQSAEITIIPPAYTRKSARNQKDFSLLVESGSQVVWKVQTTEPVAEMSLIFNDKERLNLEPLNKAKTVWQARRAVQKPGFYQIEVNEQLSELYQLKIIHDRASFIRIITPKQYTTIDFGEPQIIRLKASIMDDYGVKSAVIIATTASGRGEGVNFKEQQLSFAGNFKAFGRNYNLQKNIDLNSLGMVPGDELYFYVKALDNLNQESRSETYFVTMKDTAELMSMEGLSSGVNLVPEYFRSMRQIIIDTEKLIKDRPSISSDDFKNRSNNLGIDQKLLRLRYGKFLGEESDEIEHDEHPDEEPAAFGDVTAVIKEFGHNHDDSEDATFFEPELKSKLKATLTEMWKSELRLRTYRPLEALPFEYKALRLLKDLQQKSRAYVAKTSIKTTSLKPETRLSGELDKIINPFNRKDLNVYSDPLIALRKMPQVLNNLKERKKLTSADRQILAEANRILSSKAVSNPTTYLGAVVILRKIMSGHPYSVNPSQLMIIEKTLQKTISGALKAPQTENADGTSDLSKLYFKHLSRL